jgi:hypothetical protein
VLNFQLSFTGKNCFDSILTNFGPAKILLKYVVKPTILINVVALH